MTNIIEVVNVNILIVIHFRCMWICTCRYKAEQKCFFTNERLNCKRMYVKPLKNMNAIIYKDLKYPFKKEKIYTKHKLKYAT